MLVEVAIPVTSFAALFFPFSQPEALCQCRRGKRDDESHEQPPSGGRHCWLHDPGLCQGRLWLDPAVSRSSSRMHVDSAALAGRHTIEAHHAARVVDAVIAKIDALGGADTLAH